MITQDYFQLGGKAFPQGCTFSAQEIRNLPSMRSYIVCIDGEETKWQATDQGELEKALKATYLPGTQGEIYLQVTEFVDDFQI